MQREIIFDKMEEFISELNSRGVKKIAFTTVSEKRAKRTAPGQIGVIHVKKLELLAYKDSIIFKHLMTDEPDFKEIHDFLENLGFEIKKINRNIT
jgi:hypothetical protein